MRFIFNRRDVTKPSHFQTERLATTTRTQFNQKKNSKELADLTGLMVWFPQWYLGYDALTPGGFSIPTELGCLASVWLQPRC